MTFSYGFGAPPNQVGASFAGMTTPARWEMTVALTAKAPKEECTVDITPRRLQKFKAKPGEKLKWSNTSGAEEIQSGEVTADKWGLVTLQKVVVTKAENRIVISK